MAICTCKTNTCRLSSLTLAGKEPQRDSRNSHERLEVKAIASQYEEVVSYFCYRHARWKVRRPPRRAYYPLPTIARWTSSAGDEKWKTKRIGGERDWKGNKLKENARKDGKRRGKGARGRKRKSGRGSRQCCRHPSRRRSILFLQIPRIHAAKFQLLDRSTRNVKWITIKAAGDDDAEKKNIMIQTCTYAVALFLPVIT